MSRPRGGGEHQGAKGAQTRREGGRDTKGGIQREGERDRGRERIRVIRLARAQTQHPTYYTYSSSLSLPYTGVEQ